MKQEKDKEGIDTILILVLGPLFLGLLLVLGLGMLEDTRYEEYALLFMACYFIGACIGGVTGIQACSNSLRP